MGQCPCPRCFVQKENLGLLGTKRDKNTRKKLRTDDENRQWDVKAARRIIYEEGSTVNSKRVDDLLKNRSLVPTEVSQLSIIV